MAGFRSATPDRDTYDFTLNFNPALMRHHPANLRCCHLHRPQRQLGFALARPTRCLTTGSSSVKNFVEEAAQPKQARRLDTNSPPPGCSICGICRPPERQPPRPRLSVGPAPVYGVRSRPASPALPTSALTLYRRRARGGRSQPRPSPSAPDAVRPTYPALVTTCWPMKTPGGGHHSAVRSTICRRVLAGYPAQRQLPPAYPGWTPSLAQRDPGPVRSGRPSPLRRRLAEEPGRGLHRAAVTPCRASQAQLEIRSLAGDLRPHRASIRPLGARPFPRQS